jgi:hypothetical protein
MIAAIAIARRRRTRWYRGRKAVNTVYSPARRIYRGTVLDYDPSGATLPLQE